MKKILLIGTGGTIASEMTDAGVLEACDMTTEAVLARLMRILGCTRDPREVRRLFYTPVERDLLRPAEKREK